MFLGSIVAISTGLAGCGTNYGPIDNKEFEATVSSVGEGKITSGPVSDLKTIRDSETFSPEECSILTPLKYGSPYKLSELDQNDPGYSLDFNSSTPQPNRQFEKDYRGNARLFPDETKASAYYNDVAQALRNCPFLDTTFEGKTTRFYWSPPNSPIAPNILTWKNPLFTGMMIQKHNMILLVTSTSTTPPDISTDAGAVARKMGAW
ncbi:MULTISPECIES: hypothetical protein [Arthrobacter]|uniref:hypothetical protein n=1 Tax=Arthrobacter TaxID=1663 RepID=UPI00197A77E1|nr:MULTISPECIES: hypothetical protein [Arthrobacter]